MKKIEISMKRQENWKETERHSRTEKIQQMKWIFCKRWSKGRFEQAEVIISEPKDKTMEIIKSEEQKVKWSKKRQHIG